MKKHQLNLASQIPVTRVTAILASDKNGVIGDGPDIPWSLKDDLLQFKQRTKNNIVIMGRKTFVSIGKPLPDRVNIVVSSGHFKHDDKVVVARSLEDALEKAATIQEFCERKVFLIGGATLYDEAFDKDYVSEVVYSDVNVVLTQLERPVKVNLSFLKKFELLESIPYLKSGRNQYDFTVMRLMRPLHN